MLFLFISFTVFVPFAFLVYNGNTATYIEKYGNGEYTGTPGLIFTAVIVGLALSVAVQVILLFIYSDKNDEKKNRLFRVPVGDCTCVIHIGLFILSIVHLLLLRAGVASFAAVIITDAVLIICELIVLIIPDGDKSKKREGNTGRQSDSIYTFADYLDKIADKSSSPALSDSIRSLTALVRSIDTSLSHDIIQLENELSAKCVEAESAVSNNDGTKITVITRELYDITERIKSRIASAVFTLKGDSLDFTDNSVAEGLIDEILDSYNIDDEADIINVGTSLLDDLRFVKAKRFADDEYRILLEGYEQTVRDEAEKKAAEQSRLAAANSVRFRRITNCGYILIALFMSAVTFALTVFLQPGGFSYRLKDDGTIGITGYNPMYGSKLTVPSEIGGKKVTSIEKNAIRNESKITDITLPEGIISIGFESMRDLEGLRNLYLPSSLESIGNYAFKNNDYMKIHYSGSADDFMNMQIGNLGNGILFRNTGVAGEKVPNENVIVFGK